MDFIIALICLLLDIHCPASGRWCPPVLSQTFNTVKRLSASDSCSTKFKWTLLNERAQMTTQFCIFV
jgi:hypothetical protein